MKLMYVTPDFTPVCVCVSASAASAAAGLVWSGCSALLSSVLLWSLL
jgi:hypothetical protein